MHIINLAICCLNETSYYNFMSSLLGQNWNPDTCVKSTKQNQLAKRWTPPPNGSIKINVDASRKQITGSTTNEYVYECVVLLF